MTGKSLQEVLRPFLFIHPPSPTTTLPERKQQLVQQAREAGRAARQSSRQKQSNPGTSLGKLLEFAQLGGGGHRFANRGSDALIAAVQGMVSLGTNSQMQKATRAIVLESLQKVEQLEN